MTVERGNMHWDPRETATDGYVCPPCPVFYPTHEEFKHPLKYISSIRHIGMQAGICKIVPPSGWQPPFAINEKTFRFRTRVQQLNCIEGHTRAEGNFVDALRMFLYRNGTPMQELPRVDGQLLNLYALFKTVVEMGGYDKVCELDQWAQVVRRVGRTRASDNPTAAMCATYRCHYKECLLAYERRESAKLQTPDVQREVPPRGKAKRSGDDVTSAASSVASSTSAATLSATKTRSSMKKERARRSADAEDEDEEEGTTSKRVKRTLFSDGDLTSSEDSDSLVDIKEEDRSRHHTTRSSKENARLSANTTVKNEPASQPLSEQIKEEHTESRKLAPRTAAQLEPRSLKPSATRRYRLDPPEIYVGQKFYQYFPQSGAVIGEVVRVVGGKKPHVQIKYPADGTRDSVDLSTMQIVIANGWDPESAELAFKSEICQTCLRGDCWDHLLLCDGCNGGHHLFCLDEPLSEVPAGDWYCDACVQDSVTPSKDANPKFGFEMGSEYNLASYKEKADSWKRAYFGVATDDELNRLTDRDLEREYWRILGTPLHEQRLEVEYGSDVDSGAVGSGFPRADDYMKSLKAMARRMRILSEQKGATETQKQLSQLFTRGLEAAMQSGMSMEELVRQYSLDDWNLNNLPKLSGSVLQHLDEDIKGVMIPWIYIGMCFSTFCWHVEDHNFYSISYLHCGAPKTWYGVPCDKASYFESVMKKLTPELFGSQPDLHLQLVTMFSPETLIKHGVPVYRATHCPNEFMVTFPSAYHGGFNNGFNCAEAVNFATLDWLSWGALSVRNYRNYCKLPVFAHEALVVTLAETMVESSRFDYEAARDHLLPALTQLIEDSTAFEAALVKGNVVRRELTSDFARRHGLVDGTASGDGAASVGTHARSCKMTKATNSPEKAVAPPGPVAGKMMRIGKMGAVDGAKMMRMGKMGAVDASKMGSMVAARPTRMVLWAGTSGKSEGLRCSTCKQYCYLQAVVCTKCRHLSSVGCIEHFETMCKCDAENHYVYVYRYDPDHLPKVQDAMRARLRDVEDWMNERSQMLNLSTKPTVEVAMKLLVAGKKCGGAPVEHLDNLEIAVNDAKRWTERAERLLEGLADSQVSRDGSILDHALRLLDEAESLTVVPAKIETIQAMLSDWDVCKTQAEQLVQVFRHVVDSEAETSAYDLERDGNGDDLWHQNEAHRSTLLSLNDVLARVESMGVSLPPQLATELAMAKQYFAVLITANEMLRVIADFTHARNHAMMSDDDTIRGVKESDCRYLLSEAEYLERDTRVSLFKIRVLGSLMRATNVEVHTLHAALNDRSKSTEELHALWRRMGSLPVRPDQLDELANRLRLAREWEARAKELIDAVTSSARNIWEETTLTRPQLEDVEQLYDEADQHFVPASSLLRRQIHGRLQDCRRWYSSVQSLFVRQGTTEMPVQKLLFVALDKARSAHHDRPESHVELICICEQVVNERASFVKCRQCERYFHAQCVGAREGEIFSCLPCRSASRTTGRRKQRESLSYPTPPCPLFCSCRGVEQMPMICCDLCDEWYHSDCVGITQEEMNMIEVYRCARCAIKQNLYYLDKKAVRLNALGRRPALARVETFVTQLRTSLIGLPPGSRELLEYIDYVRQVECDARTYVQNFAAEFTVASFTRLDYQAEEQKLMQLMRRVTSLEVSLDAIQGNLMAIHWSLRACQLVLACDSPPQFSHLVVLLHDAKQPNFTFPRQEYYHIQQTIEDRVTKASQWVKQVKTLEVEEWNIDKARRLLYQYQELAPFLELPAAEVDLVHRVATS